MTEPWTGPLNAEEQAIIDDAWRTHRDALNVAAKEPSDRPKTLLDGFGEATGQVVALRAEILRLRAALQAIATKECVTPDIHFIQIVDIARRALDL